MANADAAFGFLPIRMVNGSPYSGQILDCATATGNSEVMFIGTPVVMAGGAVTFNEGDTLPTIALATVGTTNPILGCIIGFEPNRGDLTIKHRAASTERRVKVAVAQPDVVFKVQSDDVTALAAIGEQGSFTGVSGSTSTGYSDAEYDEATGSTAVDQWTVIGYYNAPDNDPTLANSILEVICSHPQLGSSQVTAGV